MISNQEPVGHNSFVVDDPLEWFRRFITRPAPADGFYAPVDVAGPDIPNDSGEPIPVRLIENPRFFGLANSSRP